MHFGALGRAHYLKRIVEIQECYAVERVLHNIQVTSDKGACIELKNSHLIVHIKLDLYKRLLLQGYVRTHIPIVQCYHFQSRLHPLSYSRDLPTMQTSKTCLA